MSDSIDYLEGQNTAPALSELEAVRMRPGMYIGDTDLKGYHRRPQAKALVHHLTYNAIRQFCTESPDIARQLIERLKR